MPKENDSTSIKTLFESHSIQEGIKNNLSNMAIAKKVGVSEDVVQKIREENSKVTTVSKGPANSPRPVKRNSNTIHGLKLEIAFLQKENDRLKLSDIRLKQSIFALIIIVFILSGMVGFEIWQTSKITQISTNKERLYQQIKRQLSESQENASEK